MRAREKAFLAKVAEAHLKLARCHESAAGGEELDHEAMKAAHADVAECALAMCKSLDSDELEKSMVTPAVSSINPNPERQVRRVFRAGQRDFSMTDDATNVPREFEHIIKVD